MTPAPIVLFIYNRPTHTRRTVEALRKNALAKESELIVYSDAPKSPKALWAVREVREYIRTITGFKSIRIDERDRNWGLANSIINGVTTVVNQYGRVIVLEDDLITSPHFLEYMNAALDHYESDPKAFSIGAYNFPAKTMAIPREYQWDTYASVRCCSWGWATWIDRWKRVDWSMDYYETFIRDQAAQVLFNKGGPDMTQMLKMQHERRIDSWAIRFCYAHHASNMHCIYPAKTLVKNIGLDSSGMHCGVDPRREHESFDEQWVPRDFCPADNIDERIARRFYDAFVTPKPSLVSRILRRLAT
nr:glycosyltransferase [Nitrosomonas nitrosa]